MLPWLGFVVIGLVCAATTAKTRDLFNPVNIVGFGFFFNMVMATLRLSPIQPAIWSLETQLVFAQSWCFWFFLPAALLLTLPRQERAKVQFHLKTGALKSVSWGRLSALALMLTALLTNWLQSGTPLPFLNPEIDVHTSYTSGLGILSSSLGTAAACVLLMYFLKRRKWLDLILMTAVLIIPLSRLARLDLVVSLLAVLLLGYYLACRSTWKYVLVMALVGAVSVPALLIVSDYRSSRGGIYDINYAIDLGWAGEDAITEATAYYQRYLVLSFDSFDGLVRKNPSGTARTYGLFTLRPLTIGVFRLHNIVDDYPLHDYLAERSDPLLGASVIATALSYFYLDFGSELIGIPLVLYMGIILLVYVKKPQSLVMTTVYCVLASALALSSFTDLLSSVRTLYAALFASALILLSMRPVGANSLFRLQPNELP